MDTLSVAKDLLGSVLAHESPEGTTSGIICETEAYLQGDPACHAFKGQTKRNTPMYGPSYSAYIYFIYGIHRCFNVVTNPGEAVLIRALVPLEGKVLMKLRRNNDDLCSGPAKLVQAMGITPALNGHNLNEKPLYIIPKVNEKRIEVSTRIGVTKGTELPYRFSI